MSNDLNVLDLIDLISERHIQLRRILENSWKQSGDISISNSEWFIMARIYQKDQATISSVTKQVDITRQATHKFIRRLEKNGLVEILNLENNKKEKAIRLTELGKKYYEKNEELKKELVNKITMYIGVEQVALLNNILKSNWGI